MGTLEFPALQPGWPKTKDPLREFLLAPPAARTWRRGPELMFWGHPYCSPAGHSGVTCALMSFELDKAQLAASTAHIRDDAERWRTSFEDYMSILTTQPRRETGRDLSRLDVFWWEGTKQARPTSKPVVLRGHSSGRDLSVDDVESICRWCSSKIPPAIEWRLILDARRALVGNDYRKVIIESASSVEITLTDAIQRKFDSMGITFGRGLFENFRTLNGRIELAKLVGLPISESDLKDCLVKPRNQVAHRGAFPDEATAVKSLEISERIAHALGRGYAEG